MVPTYRTSGLRLQPSAAACWCWPDLYHVGVKDGWGPMCCPVLPPTGLHQLVLTAARVVPHQRFGVLLLPAKPWLTTVEQVGPG
jgi:hypothetical protein